MAAQAQEPVPRVRDSTGIRVVEYQNLRGARGAFHLQHPPERVFGGAQVSEMESFDARHPYLSVTELSNGIIVVNDRTSLKFYSRGGALLRTSGRRGSGPGEFSQTREVCLLRGDSLLVIDAADGRLSLWDREGRHLRTYARLGYIPPGACTPEATIVIRNTRVSAAGQPGQLVVPYEELRLDGKLVRRVGSLPLPEFAGPVLQELSVVPRDSELWVADPRSFEIRVYTKGGGLRRIIRILEPLPEISDAAWRRDVERMIPTSVPSNQRAPAIERMIRMKRPRRYPAFLRVRVDANKRTWVNDYLNRELWTVFDSAGLLLGQLLIPPFPGPPPPELVSILDGDRVAILSRPGDGFSQLSIHRLIPPPAARSRDSSEGLKPRR